MIKYSETYLLNSKNIDIISDKAVEICASLKMPSDQRTRVRLLLEDSLLNWMDKAGEEVEIELRSGTRFFRPYIEISFAYNEPINPIKEEEYSVYLKSVIENMAFSPDFTYSKGRNQLYIKLKKPNKNPIIKLLLIIIFSLIFGFIGQRLIPQSVLMTIQEYLIAPTYNKFLDVLGCIAGPLIFFSVAWGIYGIGDTATLNKVGKGMMLIYLRDIVIAVVLCVVFFPIFGCVLSGGKVDFIQILSIYQLFLDMLPVTIVDPFVTGNTIQIIVLAVVVGIALLYLGSKTRYVAVAIEQINFITSFLMEFISKLVPYFIFLVLVNMIWSGSLSTFAQSWKYIICLFIALALASVVQLVVVAVSNQASISVLFKKTMPSFLIALTTASSAASFGTLTKNCEEKFGVSNSLTAFGVPLGIVMHKVSSAINAIMIAFYIAGLYQMECSLSWIILAVIIAVIVAVATPPIPGGAVIGYTMLFTQLGLPDEGLVLALAIDMLSDFLVTSTNIFALPFALTNVAKRYNLLDREVLRSN